MKLRPVRKSWVVWGLVAVLVTSSMATRLTRPDQRNYTWVKLAETDHEEVFFRNELQDINLAGLLFQPNGEGPFPGAVIIHGSGASIRANGWYLTLVQYLQEHGIAVFLPDKRGSEQSGGNWRTASYQDLATDTMAAVDWMRRHDRIDPHKIGVIGMSQGGHVAPLVANQTQDLAFVVSVVSSVVPAHEQLVFEENYNLREFGIPPGLSNVFAYVGAWSLIYIRQKDHWDAIGNYDSAPDWAGLSTEALILFGEDDTNVPSIRSAAVLRAMNKSNLRIKVYPNSGHALESPRGEGDSIFREDALAEIVQFIRQATTQKD